MKFVSSVSTRSILLIRLRQWLRYSWLVFQSFAVAVFGVLYSYLLQHKGFTHSTHDVELTVIGPMALFGILYAVPAAEQVKAALERYHNVHKSIWERDERTFRHYYNIRTPGIVKIAMSTVSFALVTVVAMIDFENDSTGMFWVFLITFILSIYWVLTEELEDPVEGVWFDRRAPQAWIDRLNNAHIPRRKRAPDRVASRRKKRAALVKKP